MHRQTQSQLSYFIKKKKKKDHMLSMWKTTKGTLQFDIPLVQRNHCYRLHTLAKKKASILQYGVVVTYFTPKKTSQKTRNSYLFNVWKKISIPIPGLLWVLPSSAGSAGSTVTLVPVCLMNCCRLTCLSSLVSCSRSCCMSFNKKNAAVGEIIFQKTAKHYQQLQTASFSMKSSDKCSKCLTN